MTPLRRFATLFAAILISFTTGVFLLSSTTHAATGVNQTINFQGRLYTASGATVPDGFYNIQFKIYQDGTGTAAGNPGGTLKWTESYLNANSQGITVRNGFMSVELGSVTAFGSSVDWNQDTLWLSMNIGNTNGSCTPFASCGGDGEMVPMKRLSAVPYALNAMQLGGKTSADFIQNGTAPQTSNFNITGTGTANLLQASTLDTASAGTLTIGGTNATSISLADNVTLSGGYTLRLTGGVTSSRPASPGEGALYYDTDTKQLMVFANGKWQADRSESILVAANNSSDADKAAADYVADGTADQTEINSALTAADPAGSARKNGKVYLFAGTYNTSDVINVPNNTTLAGSGRGTLIQFANIAGQNKNMISNTDTTTGEGATIRDIRLDGNKSVNTTGTQRGIYLSGMGANVGATARQGAVIVNVWVNNFNNHGIYLNGSSNGSILGSSVQGNTGDGINVDSSNRVNVSNNTVMGNSAWGVHVSGALAIVVNGNNIANNGALAGSNSSGGIVFDGTSQNNAITNNAFRDNGTGTGASNATVYFANASNNTVTGNVIADASGTTGYAIYIFDAASTTNYFANNAINGTFTSTITNNGTNTIWGGQLSASNSSGNYMIQPAGTIELMKNTNVTGSLTASTSLLAPSFDRASAGTLSIGTNATNTTAISIGSGSVTTTVAGNLGVTLSGTTGTGQVCRNASGYLSTCDATFFAPTAANFIQNQSASVQSTSSFWISGSGRSDTSILAPTFDRGNAGALTIGGANATSISLADNTVLAAGLSLTLTGGNTASRPGSPSEGMVYYDTDTKQLLTYANGKWQADRSDAVLVAANNSSASDKDAADFVANGNTGAANDGDQVQINSALTAGSGKKVVLLAGTYVADATILIPNNTTLTGVGNGTVVELADIDATDNLIENSDTTTGTGVVIRGMKLDGRKDLNTAGVQKGIYLNGMGDGTGSSARQGANISDTIVKNFLSDGMYLSNSDNNFIARNAAQNNDGEGLSINGSNNTIANNTSQGNPAGNGISVSGSNNTINGNMTVSNGSDGMNVSSDNTSITGNLSRDNSNYGIFITGAKNTISGNAIATNLQGISLDTSFDTVVSNNQVDNNGGSTSNGGITLHDSDRNTVSNNSITDTSCTTNCYAIQITSSTSDNNSLSNNVFITSSGTAIISDAGTGTIYASQTKTQGGLDTLYKQANSGAALQIQNATGVAQLTADTTNSRIVIGSTTTDATAIVFALDSYNQATDPTGVNGAMYYNTNLNKFRCYQNGAWTDCVNTAGAGANTALSNLASTNINAALNTTAGNLTLQTTTSGNIILNPVGTVELQKTTNVTGSLTATTSVLAPTIDRSNAGALSIGNTNATSVVVGNTSGTAGVTLSASTIQVGIATSATTLQATSQTTSNTQGSAFTIQGATGNGTGNGGTLNLQGGNGGGSGIYGGNVSISGGTGTTSNGLVLLSTPTFSTTANDSACYTSGTEVASSCTISQGSVNNSSAILVGFTADGQTATLPDPSIATAGRVVYVTASNLSKDFTLSVNGGGQGNQIAMRKNTTATMIWNGADWTAAGASSSTTMQAAYDNTLQSAGGAELVVSKTSATNGLTIRDSLTNSVDGTLLSVQTKSAAGLFQVNSNVTEYVSNAGAETAGASSSTFPSSTWAAIGATTVSRNTTTNNNSIGTGQASVSVVTPATAQTGVKNTLSTSLGTKQNYNVSFTARLSSGTFTDMNVYYSVDGTTASVACTTSQAVKTSIWTKVNCAFTAPTSGITSSNAILIRQTTGTARTFYVDNLSVTIAADYNYATDGSVSDGTNFATNWTSVSSATVTRNTTVGHDASDSAQVVTAATSGQGVRNLLSINPLPSTLYRITVRAASSNSFSDFTVRYSRDGGTNFVSCADYNTQTLSTSTSSFTEVTCYITTDATTATSPYVYFTQGSATARTFYVDAFSMNLNSSTTPNVQIGGGTNGGPTTLFTLDRGASAPIASNNESLLGSMYYDTSLGKLQCYEADGWGACGSSPDNIITISPEYTNAVLHGTGVGTMTSDLCSDPLNINDGSSSQPTICGTNETYNFYKWTSPQNSTQTYSIYVTYQLPTTFKGFNSGQTSLMGRTDSSNATVNYQVYRNSASGLTACGSTIAVSTGSQSSWQLGTASGAADPSTCGFAAGNSIVFKINMSTSSNANAYVGNLNFSFNNR